MTDLASRREAERRAGPGSVGSGSRRVEGSAVTAAAVPHRLLVNVQALRALAAVLVIFVHLELPLSHLGVTASAQPLFAAGVDLFFVISGFIMVHTTARRPISPLAFLRLRVIRIVPLYWAVTLCVFVVALAVPAVVQGTVADPLALLKSLLFIPFERPDGLVRPILFVGWTLNLEMMFYLIFAATLVLRAPAARVAIGIAVLLAIVLAGRAFAGDDQVARFMTDPIILEFGLGMAIGLVYPRLPVVIGVASTGIIVGISLIAAIGLVVLPPGAVLHPIAIPAALAVFVAVALEKTGIRLASRPIVALGDASYALYLVHPFATQTAILIGTATAATYLSSAATIIAALAGAIVLGLVVHRLVEKPLVKAAAKWWPAEARER